MRMGIHMKKRFLNRLNLLKEGYQNMMKMEIQEKSLFKNLLLYLKNQNNSHLNMSMLMTELNQFNNNHNAYLSLYLINNNIYHNNQDTLKKRFKENFYRLSNPERNKNSHNLSQCQGKELNSPKNQPYP